MHLFALERANLSENMKTLTLFPTNKNNIWKIIPLTNIDMFMQQNQPVVHWRLQLGGVSVHRLASSNSSILIHIGMVNDHWLSR